MLYGEDLIEVNILIKTLDRPKATRKLDISM